MAEHDTQHGTLLDDYQRMVEALRDSELRLRTLLDTAVDGIVTIDRHGIIQDCNPAAGRMFGYDHVTLIGRNVAILMPSPHKEHHDDYIRHYLQGNPPQVIGIGREVEGRHRDGSLFPVELAISELHDGEIYFTGIIRNITTRKQLQEQIHRDQAELAHMARLSMAGEMASTLAHEINQPLTGIVTYAQLCSDMLHHESPDLTRIGMLLERIAEQGKRTAEIIRRLRRLVRRAEPCKSTVRLNDAIQDVMRLAEIDARQHRISLDLELAEELPLLQADTVQIQQVVLNLVRNSFEAITEDDSRQRRVTIRTRYRDGTLEVAVSDTGPGLSEQMRQRLFEPFVTTKVQGTGLGLSISRSIIEAHGGQLWFETHKGRGTTFCFRLPPMAGDAALFSDGDDPGPRQTRP